MPNSEDQVVITIVAVIVVLLFLGIIFLVMVLRYNSRKVKLLAEKQSMKEQYEKQLLESKLEIQEQTFDFISQEIHDNVGQVLSLAKVQLNIMEQQQKMDTSLLKDIKLSIGTAMTELREIAKSLSRERMHAFDLLEAVTGEVKRLNNIGEMKATLSVKGCNRHVIEQHKLILFRMLQEGLQNILKHAEASEISLFIDFEQKKPFIAIHDNGTGFDVQTAVKKEGGLGLKNMISRAKVLGAEIDIQSAPGQGTTITIILSNYHAS